jgi:hypothetical protein
MVLCFLTPYFIWGKDADLSKGEIIGYISMIVSLSAVFFGIKNYRDKKQNGYITFGNAFGLGLEISGVASIIFGIYNYVLYKFLAPDLSQRLIDYYKNKIINSGQSKEIIAKQLQKMQSQSDFYSNPLIMSLVMIVTVFAIGLVVSLISATILKRKELIPTNN